MNEVQARRLLARSAAFLAEFAGCFGRPTLEKSSRRYIRGLLSDKPRKSMQPMVEALTSDASSSVPRSWLWSVVLEAGAAPDNERKQTEIHERAQVPHPFVVARGSFNGVETVVQPASGTSRPADDWPLGLLGEHRVLQTQDFS